MKQTYKNIVKELLKGNSVLIYATATKESSDYLARLRIVSPKNCEWQALINNYMTWDTSCFLYREEGLINTNKKFPYMIVKSCDYVNGKKGKKC